jgi:MFS transporter, FSR family, fosmidomycin resistance protein
MEFARMKTRVTKDPSGAPAPRRARPQLARPVVGGLLAALAVELADELVDGTKSAAMPLIRHDLALSYLQIGLLAAVPLLVGSLLELPAGVIAGTGSRRQRFVLAGGIVFIASVLATGLATSFIGLLVALTIFFPASGLFVSLTQAALMDSAPDRRAQHMARWTLAGSIGAVAGPVLVAAVLGAGGTWRLAFVLIAGVGAAAWFAIATTGRHPHNGNGVAQNSVAVDDSGRGGGTWPGWRSAVSIVRSSGAVRWLVLLEVADLLLDVLTPFLALYLVAVVHVSPAVAALAIAIRLGAGLAGDLILIRLLERRDSRQVIRVSTVAALALFPAFLLVPGFGAKIVVLAALTIATAPWYPILQAELYASLPGRSNLAVSLASASGLFGALGPLAVGVLAEHFGLSWALTSMCAVPLLMLAALEPGRRRDHRPGAGLRPSARLASRDKHRRG